MPTAVVHVQSCDIATCMREMRLWLDDQRVEPSRFVFEEGGEAITVRVGFSVSVEAEQFARRFAGAVEG